MRPRGRVHPAALVALSLALASACGWNDSCDRPYVFEDSRCGLASGELPFRACLGASGASCPAPSACTSSTLPSVDGENLCTFACDADERCAAFARGAAYCLGAGSARQCYRACGAGDACGEHERCQRVAAPEGLRPVCVPRRRPYRPCTEAGAPCVFGGACARVTSRAGAPALACTREGCAVTTDCLEHEFGVAVCAPIPSVPTRRRCSVRCTSDTDCAPYETVCGVSDRDGGPSICVPR